MKTALICLGGGFNGAIGTGYLKYIWDEWPERSTISYIQLISVSVLNGLYLLSGGTTDELINIWLEVESIGRSSVFRLLDIPTRIKSGTGLFSHHGIEKLIRRLKDHRKIISSEIDAEIVTRNEPKKRLDFFSIKIPEQKLKKVAIAATSLPGIFSPVIIDGDRHSDALVPNLERAVSKKCNRIIILNFDHDNYFSNEDEYWLTRLGKGLSMLLYDWIDERVDRFKQHHPECNVIELKLKKPLPQISTFSINQGKRGVKRAIDFGYETAKKNLQ